MSEPPAADEVEPDEVEPDEVEPAEVSRVEERRALRRDRRRRRLLLGTAAVLAAFAVVNIVIAVERFTSDGAGAARSGGSSAGAAGSGAYLTDPDAATAFLAGAVSDIAAVSSYDYRRLDDALSLGQQVTTGRYRAAFTQALTGSAAATLRADRTVQDFQLLSSGIGTVASGGRSAQVLLFGQQTRTSTAGTSNTVVTLVATMVRSGDRYLIGGLESDANAGLPPGTPELAVAAEAGREELANALSYRHDHFDSDYQRALDGAVDPLRTKLTANRAATRAAVVGGAYDLTGTVVSLAVERASGDVVVLMMAATTARTPGGGPLVPTQFEVTVVRVQGTWITSVIAPVQSG